MPVAFEDMLVEESDAAVADAHGRRGEVINVFTVQEVVLKLGFGEQIRGFAKELSEQADLSDISLLGTLSLTAELKRGDHLLTQWSHETASLPELVRCRFEKGDMVKGIDGGRQRGSITAASAAYLNKGL